MKGGMDASGTTGGDAGAVTGGIVSVGFEIEGCGKSKDDSIVYGKGATCMKLHTKDSHPSDRRAIEPFTLDYFGDLQYFDLVYCE